MHIMPPRRQQLQSRVVRTQLTYSALILRPDAPHRGLQCAVDAGGERRPPRLAQRIATR